MGIFVARAVTAAGRGPFVLLLQRSFLLLKRPRQGSQTLAGGLSAAIPADIGAQHVFDPGGVAAAWVCGSLFVNFHAMFPIATWTLSLAMQVRPLPGSACLMRLSGGIVRLKAAD
jgi:hypothetical protein